jgi:type II secretory ATPase GspE/PulE/Tfp pilus assembly ATPase PilB-like protein
MASSKERSNEVSINIIKLSSPAELSSKIASLSLNEAATTVLLEEVLSGALGLESSDIHFEPTKENVKIRVRVDGILREAGALYNEDYKYLLSRIKLLGGVKLNIKETAQDGRFTIVNEEDGANIEVRVSVNPSEYGATVVMRLLDPKMAIVDVKNLGLRLDDFKKIENNLKKPNGMILVTGPTGSGKTTTLYSFINSINSPEIKIITIEDPIEYHLKGIQQTQVDASAGYDFDNGLESILRQDPDVIFVGEIRDTKTAGIAVQAALTGHIVFSTLHTNTAAGAIPRLLDLEVKPHTIGPSVNAILAQRLVRKLCPKCRKKAETNKEISEKIAKFASLLPKDINLSEKELYEPVGCPSCIDGYKGRTGIFEVFEIDKDIEQLIHEESSEVEIEAQIVGKGFISMQQDGIIKALMGITSLAEVERATGPLNW